MLYFIVLLALVFLFSWLYTTADNTTYLRRSKVSATGWFAYFRSSGREQYLPLVCWDVSNDEPAARGMVLTGDAKGAAAYCDLLPGFVAYVHMPEKV